MIDTAVLRAEPERVRQALQERGGHAIPDFERFLAMDRSYRKISAEIEALRAERNAYSQSFGKAKISGSLKEREALSRQTAQIKERLEQLEGGLARIQTQREAFLLRLPNLPHESVPSGQGEGDNRIVREAGIKPVFDFKPLDHQCIGEKLGILDFAAAARLSGARFALWKGAGAKLIRALISYQLEMHSAKGYQEIWPPLLVRPEILKGTGQLPKFDQDLYKTQGNERGLELYLIPTAEVPLTNLVRDEIIPSRNLPFRFMAYTPCFRQEAGSYGRDVRGLIRNHQFDKVELVWVTEAERSLEALKELTQDAEAVLASLKISYRVVELCAGDLGFASRKTYDLEVWMPSEGRYREISSCSDCGSFQARRMNARCRKEAKDATAFVHTLNGSGVAVGRLAAAILENFQLKSGAVEIPQGLVPFFGAPAIS